MFIPKHWVSYSDLTLSMLFFGATLVIGKTLILLFPIFLLLAIRFLIGTLFFGLIYYLKNHQEKQSIKKLSNKDWILLFLQSFFGAFCFNLFILFGLRYTTADTAAIITSTLPAFITIFSFFILKEFISSHQFIAIVLVILGAVLVTVDTQHIIINQAAMYGNLFVLLAVVTGALFPICAKLTLTKTSSQLTSFTFNAFGLLLFLPLALGDAMQFNFHSITFTTWVVVIFYSAAANILYLHFWNKGLTVVSASTASLFTAVMPASTAIFAYFFLQEALTTHQMVGMLCILGAVGLGIRQRHVTPMLKPHDA